MKFNEFLLTIIIINIYFFKFLLEMFSTHLLVIDPLYLPMILPTARNLFCQIIYGKFILYVFKMVMKMEIVSHSQRPSFHLLAYI